MDIVLAMAKQLSLFPQLILLSNIWIIVQFENAIFFIVQYIFNI